MIYVRGIIVRAGSALPSVCMGCTICYLFAQTYGKTHLLRDVKICPESTWLAGSRPPVLSFIARFQTGFAPTSVLAEDGSARRWSLHWGKDVEGSHLESRG